MEIKETVLDQKPEECVVPVKKEIPEAQKWAPPPRLKNLRSKKNKKGPAAHKDP